LGWYNAYTRPSAFHAGNGKRKGHGKEIIFFGEFFLLETNGSTDPSLVVVENGIFGIAFRIKTGFRCQRTSSRTRNNGKGNLAFLI